MSETTVHVVLPERSQDEVSEGLRALTKRLEQLGHGPGSYGIGGQDGYGVDFTNDVFSMRPYCWCESEGCAWCGRGAPNFVHKDSYSAVWWYKWIGRDQHARLGRPWADILSDCFASLDSA